MMKNVDQEIINRIKNGDKNAYDLLVVKYQQRIINILLYMVKDYSDALDITQEAFIKAYRALPKFRGDSSFYTWLYKIAVNTAKNHIITKSKHSHTYGTSEMEQMEHHPALTDIASSEDMALRDELKDVIFDTIENLPPDLRMSIRLRELEGLSYEEIATAMDCPIGTVRSRIFRAREAIDNKIKPLLKK